MYSIPIQQIENTHSLKKYRRFSFFQCHVCFRTSTLSIIWCPYLLDALQLQVQWWWQCHLSDTLCSQMQERSQPLLLEILPLENETGLDVSKRIEEKDFWIGRTINDKGLNLTEKKMKLTCKNCWAFLGLKCVLTWTKIYVENPIVFPTSLLQCVAVVST